MLRPAGAFSPQPGRRKQEAGAAVDLYFISSPAPLPQLPYVFTLGSERHAALLPPSIALRAFPIRPFVHSSFFRGETKISQSESGGKRPAGFFIGCCLHRRRYFNVGGSACGRWFLQRFSAGNKVRWILGLSAEDAQAPICFNAVEPAALKQLALLFPYWNTFSLTCSKHRAKELNHLFRPLISGIC